jgi:O-antigen/teichoic acid export membrane protein
MKSIEQHCPTYTRWCIWLWNSPTFTTWGKFLAQSLSLFAVTPLLLTRFDETEIAAWYIFASLNFFGTVLSQRLGLTFSRMFAFAMAGASNLSPITGKREQENDGKPNWTAFERAYGTIGSINLAVGWVNVLIAFGMGWYGLNNILEGYTNPGLIWAAFGVTQLTSLLSFIYQRYSIALQGMNYIALSNRWQIIFSVVGIVVGFIALTLDANMLVLILVMRPLTLLGLLRNRFLLGHVENGRVLTLKGYGFDREVFNWAWPPAWKGFIVQFSLFGSGQIASIIYTGIGTKADVASYLFAMRIIDVIDQIARAPVYSVGPLMSRLSAAGEVDAMSKLVNQRMRIALSLLACACLFAAVLMPVLLELIGSNIYFIPQSIWLLLGALLMLSRFNFLSMLIASVGNQVFFYWRSLLATVVGAMSLMCWGEEAGLAGPILASYVPLIILLNFAPTQVSARILGEKVINSRVLDFTLIMGLYVIIALALVYLI